MKTLNIKTYGSNTKLAGEYFFILSKGYNTGKPLTNPCPNCYVLLASTPEEKNLYFWLLYGLWQANYFHPYLCGSVIPFLHISELKTIIYEAATKVLLQKDQFLQAINTLRNLEEYQTTLQKQLHLIKQAKRALILNALK